MEAESPIDEPAKSSGVASVALGLGIASFVMAFVPWITFATWLIAIPGIVLSIIGLVKSASKIRPILGLVFSIVGWGISLFAIFITAAWVSPETFDEIEESANAPEVPDTSEDLPIEDTITQEDLGFGDGTYIVGESISPGIYRSEGSELCYWETLSGFGGSLEEILANGNNSTIIAIDDLTVGFSTNGCGQWIEVTESYPPEPLRTFGDGTFEVGKHIEPGRYSSSGGSNCYFERLSGFSQRLEDIIANEVTDSPAVVDIAASDIGFSSRGCGTWSQ